MFKRSVPVACLVFLLGALILAAPGLSLYAAEGEAAAGAGQADQKPEKKPMSGLVWVLWSSGLIGLFILGLSIYFVALVVRLFLRMTVDLAVPPDLVMRLSDLVKNRDFQGAYDTARQDDSFLGRVLAAGIAQSSSGLMDARDAMERAGDAETVSMEKQISMLAVLGTLGPMIGLIGTLKGMISSFSVIALSGTHLDPGQVAGGISEALILTFEGVFLSVPAIYFYAFFRNRVATITSQGMLTAEELLRHFYRMARCKAGTGAGQPAAALGG